MAAAFDIVMLPCAADGKVRDVEKMPDGSIDVCLFNGGIRTSEQEYMAQLHAAQIEGPGGLRLLRQRGLHSRPGNMNTRKQVFDTVYKEGSSTAPVNPQDVRPQPETKCPRARCTCRSSTTR